MSENMEIFELAKKLKDRKEAKSELEEQQKAVSEEIKNLEQQLSSMNRSKSI